MRGFIRRAIGMMVISIVAIGSAQAALVITAVESGGDVVFSTDGGSLDLTGLFNSQSDVPMSQYVRPASGQLAIGGGGLADVYQGISGTGAGGFGPGTTQVFADSGTGASLLLAGSSGSGLLFVPAGYISGAAIGPSTATFNSATFASLGMNEGGSYTWSWAADSVTLNIVPIPAAVWLFGSALAGLGWMRRKA